MSRVGIREIQTAGVEVTIANSLITVKGPLGTLSMQIFPGVKVVHENGVIKVSIENDELRAMWGTTQALISNMVHGVSKGFSKTIEFIGVGYRGSVQGKVMTLKLGYSHDVVINVPDEVEVKFPAQNILEVSSFCKSHLGAFAAKVKSLRKPDPYKGKGIFCKGDYIIRKEGKKKKK